MPNPSPAAEAWANASSAYRSRVRIALERRDERPGISARLATWVGRPYHREHLVHPGAHLGETTAQPDEEGHTANDAERDLGSLV